MKSKICFTKSRFGKANAAHLRGALRQLTLAEPSTQLSTVGPFAYLWLFYENHLADSSGSKNYHNLIGLKLFLLCHQ
jgi:hypothetical protein